eukprot:COSAG02_NODE_10134_length_2013_cov_4.381400_2_plen_94_part_00
MPPYGDSSQRHSPADRTIRTPRTLPLWHVFMLFTQRFSNITSTYARVLAGHEGLCQYEIDRSRQKNISQELGKNKYNMNVLSPVDTVTASQLA